MSKILVIRFSSIGDIILTTPVIRCLKKQVNQAQIHVVTKTEYSQILAHNPYVDKLHCFDKDVDELYETLQKENFDVVIDLHKNLRSFRLKQKLAVKSYSFNKINVQKFLAVKLKSIKSLPPQHIVERYLNTVLPLGVVNDGMGLDFFTDKKNKISVPQVFPSIANSKFIALVVGGSYYTKQIPLNKLKQICNHAVMPVVLMGGKSDIQLASQIQKDFPFLINACGQFNLLQSASVIEQSAWVITPDTGLMHIAAAYHKKIISVWGNTIPEFGMGPYLPTSENRILQIKNLSCRPCSKLGYKKCPKGHFKCMNEIDFTFVKELK